MKINDIIIESEDEICEARMTWSRNGSKIVRKYRCTSGPRKGRVVSSPAQCSKPIDVKKRMALKRTKARLGSRMARRSKRTKKINPASKLIKRLNK